MTVIALVLFAVHLATAFEVRTWLQWPSSGDTGFRGLSGRLHAWATSGGTAAP